MAGAFGGGFSQGLAQAMQSTTPLLVQQRMAENALEEKKAEHKLKEKMMALQGQMLEMQLQERIQKMMVGAMIGSQIEAMGTTPGAVGPTEEFGEGGEPPTVGPPQVASRNTLAALMARGGQTGEALKLMPELTEPPPELLARRSAAQMEAQRPLLEQMGVLPKRPSGAPADGAAAPAVGAPPIGPMGAPGTPGPAPGQAPGPTGPAMTFQPTFNFAKDGSFSWVMAGQRVNLNVQHYTKDTPEGPQIFERVFNTASGGSYEYAVGRPAPPQKLEEMSQTITNAWGIPRSNPLHGRLLGALTLMEGLPAEQRGAALQKMDGEIKGMMGRPGGSVALSAPGTNIMGPTPGAPAGPARGSTAAGLSTPGELAAGAKSAADAEALAQQGKQTRQGETIKREEQPLSVTVQSRINFFRDARAGLGTIKETYRPAFVGKGFEPLIAGTESRFQQALKAVNGDVAAGKIDAYAPGSFAGAVRTFLGTASEQETGFRRSVLDVADLILRARSGAQINEQEAARLTKTLFTATDSPKVFEAALTRFEQSINTSLRSTMEGAVMSPKEQLQRERTQQEPVGIPAPQGAAKKPVMRVTPDGRWVPVP